MFDERAPLCTQIQQYQRSVFGRVTLRSRDRESTLSAYAALSGMRELNPSLPPLPRMPGQ
jgi:hypothetical protein